MSQSDHDRAGPGLSDDARALIAGALDADEPSRADRQRVHAALMGAIASGAGVAASAAASTASAASAGAGSAAAGTAATGTAAAGAGIAGLSTGFASFSLGAKLAAVAIVVGAVGTTAAMMEPWQPDEVAPQTHASGPADRAAPAPSWAPSGERPAPRPAAVAAREDAPRPDDIEPAGTQPAALAEVARPRAAQDSLPVRARRNSPSAPEPAAPRTGAPTTATAETSPPQAAATEAPAPSTLADEVQLLRRAQRAIHEQAPERALSLLAEHESRFPEGVLVAERDAARAMALCSTERTAEAQAAVRRFLSQHPSSPLAPRVRAACE